MEINVNCCIYVMKKGSANNGGLRKGKRETRGSGLPITDRPPGEYVLDLIIIKCLHFIRFMQR